MEFAILTSKGVNIDTIGLKYLRPDGYALVSASHIGMANRNITVMAGNVTNEMQDMLSGGYRGIFVRVRLTRDKNRAIPESSHQAAKLIKRHVSTTGEVMSTEITSAGPYLTSVKGLNRLLFSTDKDFKRASGEVMVGRFTISALVSNDKLVGYVAWKIDNAPIYTNGLKKWFYENNTPNKKVVVIGQLVSLVPYGGVRLLSWLKSMGKPMVLRSNTLSMESYFGNQGFVVKTELITSNRGRRMWWLPDLSLHGDRPIEQPHRGVNILVEWMDPKDRRKLYKKYPEIVGKLEDKHGDL